MDAAQQGPLGDTGTDRSILKETLGFPPSLPCVQFLWLQESKQGSTHHREAPPQGLLDTDPQELPLTLRTVDIRVDLAMRIM